ncbi:3-ketoacyl-CoA thiolase with broad chain length specificity [Pseudogymnoascus verrucosus]|uniref:3-ketoacyl-CoA thiolase with broad chain length specificity n=1 Tax=Pseudogymnoascus verrucosus TaxID=342668 RepID=A0A1B8GSS9_9PEZI|nr:3-ketoacyl-CoA thiolase with broad chain length specificity [Pseudogymnoascus verrucosus]OBT98893.1 3-ketoacyl-CoA thiolase with broad chain length specificity [Pseudogymnoascus verrucosus]
MSSGFKDTAGREVAEDGVQYEDPKTDHGDKGRQRARGHHGQVAQSHRACRSTAARLGPRVLGKYITASVVGVALLLMGVGPWAAIPLAIEKTGVTKEAVDGWEINKAFGS